MLANDLATYLRANMTIPAGVQISVGYAAPETPLVIMLINPIQGFKGNKELPRYYKGPFQVVVRHTDPLLGWTLANQVNQTLTLNEVTVAGYLVNLMNPTTEPVLYPRNSAELYELSSSFDLIFTA